MKKHYLKIEKKYLERILSGEKTVEIRFNDRDYQRGDLLVLEDKHTFAITHVHSGLGMAENYVALSIKKWVTNSKT